ncbi:ATP-binding protein, partial [bacterium]|nr:ATP-binding protein [candidate division CSSED10-310 bacterium]
MKRFPFPAIVGQQRLKTAYLANIIDPDIGGLLISGPKGTGKSTIVHSVESILPEYDAVANCPFRCNPSTPQKHCCFCSDLNEFNVTRYPTRIVTLPLSSTEDRLIGSVNVEKLLKEGIKDIQPGILGEANRNILYIDEVNLLPDHLVDDILDAAASHWNSIEREGVSFRHPSEFILVGTMNPEEGELRPQILDRFPLCVRVQSVTEPELRVEIIKRNQMFTKNADALLGIFENEIQLLKNLIVDSRDLLTHVITDNAYLYAIARSCSDLKVDGQRPDIVINRTSQAIAALFQRKIVQPEDVLLSAELALAHRTRDGGLLAPPTEDEIISIFKKHLSRIDRSNESESDSSEKPDKMLEHFDPIERYRESNHT